MVYSGPRGSVRDRLLRWGGGNDFAICEYSVKWRDVAGVFIFAGQDPDGGKWFPLYIDRTESFAEDIPGHPEWQEAQWMGATHVHAKVEPNGPRRGAIKSGLIVYYKPPLSVT